MRTRIASNLLLLACLVSATQRATGQASAARPADTSGVRSLAAHDIPTLKALLRDLIAAEEAFWADHGTYTTDLRVLGLRDRQDGGYSLSVVAAGGRSWYGLTVLASGDAAAGCATFVGDARDFPTAPTTPRDRHPLTMEAVVLCDDAT